MTDPRWSNGRRRLTANQESVFRVVFQEEVESGATPAEAYREAERYMNEDALPDWQQFWKDWNTPHPLAPILNAVLGIAAMHILVSHAEQAGGMIGEQAKTLRSILS